MQYCELIFFMNRDRVDTLIPLVDTSGGFLHDSPLKNYAATNFRPAPENPPVQFYVSAYVFGLAG